MAARMSIRILQNKILHFQRSPCCLCSTSKQNSTQVTNTDSGLKHVKDIVIPKRKIRDSTAILRALASTVERDPLAAEYTFIDDPITIPASYEQKKMFALSRAAGQRAARFMMNEVPEAFAHDEGVPHIKAYDPDVTEYQHTQATEEALIERIELRRVAHAIEVYRTMKRLEVPASQSTLQSLLELLCMYNHEDQPHLYPTERQYLLPKDLDRISTWNGGCLAEQIFEELPEKTAEAYNAVIRGMVKHKSAERGYRFYKEMKEKQLPVYKKTYIEILERSPAVVGVHHGKIQDYADRGQSYWDLVLALLQDMKDSGIPPCGHTFTAILKSLILARVEKKLDKLDNVLNEMHMLGFEPTLQDWNHILNIVFTSTGPSQKLQCVTLVLQELKKKLPKIETLEDAQFFLTAMLKIGDNLSNTKLGIELNELRESLGQSVKLRAQDDFMYYKTFMKLITQTELADYVMEQYNKIVPHAYVPASDVYWVIIDCLKLHSALQHMPQLLEDILLMIHKDLNKLAAHLFGVLAEKKSKPELQGEFVKMADIMFTYWTDSVEWIEAMAQSNRVYGIQRDVMNGELFGYLIEIALNSDDLDRAWKYFTNYRQHIEEFQDRPKDRAYTALFKAFFDSRDPEKIMTIITTMSDQNVPVVYRLIDEAKEELDSMLDDSQRSELNRL